jgi:hypothetical protein
MLKQALQVKEMELRILERAPKLFLALSREATSAGNSGPTI